MTDSSLLTSLRSSFAANGNLSAMGASSSSNTAVSPTLMSTDTVSTQSTALTSDEKLAIFDQVLTDLEATPAALPSLSPAPSVTSAPPPSSGVDILSHILAAKRPRPSELKADDTVSTPPAAAPSQSLIQIDSNQAHALPSSTNDKALAVQPSPVATQAIVDPAVETAAFVPAPVVDAPTPPDVITPSTEAVSPAMEGTLAQAFPQATLQTAQTLNPPNPSGTTVKESAHANGLSAVEAAAALQVVENEKTPEIPPEVESFLQRVEEHKDQAPTEVVIADGSAALPSTTRHPSQPVVVLPITPDVEKIGKRKGAAWSIRWLVEWSEKIIKVFTGKVIYREA